MKNMVPVVISYPDTHQVAPLYSYISVQDFTSPRHLAEYLIYLDQNDEAYLEYLMWKGRYKVEGSGSLASSTFCLLCDYLHSDLREPRIVPDIRDWFESGSDCVPDILNQLKSTV